MAEKLPYFPFYTGDWMKDPRLSMCSPSTRGIWLDAICAMHESSRTGRLSGTVDQLSRVCRSTLTDMHTAIAELTATGTATITERSGVVTLINRRMEREHNRRQDDKKRQRLYRDKRDVTPESRGRHNPKSVSSSVSTSSSDENPPAPEFADLIPDQLRTPPFLAAWAEFVQHRREIRHALTPTSTRRALNKLGSYGPEIATASVHESIEHGWQGVFPEKVSLKGQRNGRTPKPTPDQRGEYGGPTGGGRRQLPDAAPSSTPAIPSELAGTQT